MPDLKRLLCRGLFLCFFLLTGFVGPAEHSVIAAEGMPAQAVSRVFAFEMNQGVPVNFRPVTAPRTWSPETLLYVPAGSVYVMENGLELRGEGVFNGASGAADPALLALAQLEAEKFESRFIDNIVDSTTNENCASQPCS